MNKIQVSSGRSSAATHRLTQASTTLNRRYVRRPANIAIEEAARAASIPHPEEVSSGRPSRLVNLRVRAADLEAAREQQLTATASTVDRAPVQPVAMYPQVIELGGIDPASSTVAPATTPEPSTPLELVSSNPVVPTEPVATPEPYPEIQPRVPETTPVQPEIDTSELAMSIAADYAAASLGASMKEYGNNYNSYAMPDPNTAAASPELIETSLNSTPATPDSVDAIAQAASEAIAAIRTATEPSEVSEQVASLKAFADNIKSNHNTPEMRELSDTIDKFVSIAMKSGKIDPNAVRKSTKAPAKPALSSKATRAAAKVTKTSAKVMAKNRTKAMVTPTMATGRMATKSMPRSNAMSRPAKRLSSTELKERAIEQALESVATMNESTPKTKRRQPAMRAKRKGGVKRFVIAFTCAALCVGGVIAFVGSNIPDISVRVAAMQTGITAAYPSYVPRDYKLGDIFSESGKITMVFDGPAGASFTLEEEKSSWDSSALLRNFVEVAWGEDYATTHEQGITIYIAESTSDAVWVNGGVLYKITSSGTPLTKKQVRSIVTSL